MIKEEIEFFVEKSLEENIKILKRNGFNEMFHVRTIANYYLPSNVELNDIRDVKDKCIRIRKSVRNDYSEGFKLGNSGILDKDKYSDYYSDEVCEIEIKTDKEALDLENRLLSDGYKLIYTDDKDDNVYEINNREIVFQLQDLKDIGLIIAYDNSKYYGLDKYKQTLELIKDVEKYGIRFKGYDKVNRFSKLNDKNYKPISLKNVIDLLLYK